MSKIAGNALLGIALGCVVNSVWYTDHWWQWLVTAVVVLLVAGYALGDSPDKEDKK